MNVNFEIKIFFRTRKSDSPSRFREGPVTRLCGNAMEKNEKQSPKTEQDEADDDSSRESEKQDNNDNSENEDVSSFLFKSF